MDLNRKEWGRFFNNIEKKIMDILKNQVLTEKTIRLLQ